MKLVKATEKDITLIQDLAKKSWENAYAEILSDQQVKYMLETMYSKEEIIEHLKNPNYHYDLIWDENKNSFDGFMGYEHNYDIGTTKLHRIYLIPESKGKGLGKEAILFLARQALETGDKRIILNVNKYNSAINFYKSLGFSVYGEGIFDIGNNFFMDDYLMELLIHDKMD
ncbi:GNAT family N-acetyltransferase [Chryseobacterium potabilaquae]|uniref:Spermidine/spermine N(1)-acetyltransferase n=1 Tax=Chryseobacterium potabilaquae TaxID=2675057 RepID=A0A6N4X914_9FLAO|nr:GNAT family N-acetyltransferase [Chryseobacterium potabilaquae]CAA7194903.1 Spermidine/spermine N(1)-acetyltransferase [Chryseobacterium potabilaquae]